MTSVSPASSGEQAIAGIGGQKALPEAAAAACRDCSLCRAKVEAYTLQWALCSVLRRAGRLQAVAA